MQRAFLATVFMLTASAVHANECADALTQADMNACAARAYEASDAELNQLYRQIEQRLGDDADARGLLVAAQRAWLGFRDAECAFASSGVEGGSAWPSVRAMCLDGLARKRVEELGQYLVCPEGDLSCPVPAE